MVSDAIVLLNANFLQESRMNFHKMGKCGNSRMDTHGEQENEALGSWGESKNNLWTW